MQILNKMLSTLFCCQGNITLLNCHEGVHHNGLAVTLSELRGRKGQTESKGGN